VVFLSDRGADGNWSFFRVGLDGQGLVELTPGERLDRDAPIEPDRARGRLFYSARRMDEAGSAVYELPLEPGATPRRLHATTVPSVLADVSPDGKLLAVIRSRRTARTTSSGSRSPAGRPGPSIRRTARSRSTTRRTASAGWRWPSTRAAGRALRERGVTVEYMVAEDEGHSLARRENQVAFMARAARFLEDVLR
jgi:dipeptidyl aminopeptidase/acylaminoacyl peptidase